MLLVEQLLLPEFAEDSAIFPPIDLVEVPWAASRTDEQSMP